MTDGARELTGFRSLRWPSRLVADVLTVGGLSAVVGVLLAADVVTSALPPQMTDQLLTLGAAAVGAGAAILALVAARLLGEPKPAWIASALVLYCAVVVPWSTLATADLDVAHRASRLVAYATALVLLLLSIRPPRALGSWGGWVIMLVGGVAALAALLLPASVTLRGLVDGPILTIGVLAGWTAVAVAFAVEGIRKQSTPRLRIGLGLVVLAVAQLYRVASAMPTSGTNLAFSALRLVGLLVVLVGFAQLVQRAMTTLRSAYWQQQEELTVAALHMERASELAAERSHELRNGLAGLAGITHLLSTEADGEDHERLKHAVLAELGRLHRILDGAEADRLPQATPDGYAVQPVLADLVALRRSRDGRLDVDVEDGLRARGDAAVLAQVVANLLANCDRHAPGAPVQVRAFRRDATVVVEVRDQGPGLPAGAEESALHRGVRDKAAGGSGLGLYISSGLVAREGGTLRLQSVQHPQGCLAVVVLPMAESPDHSARR